MFCPEFIQIMEKYGKSWMEFSVEIFKILKSLKNDHRYRKIWKKL